MEDVGYFSTTGGRRDRDPRRDFASVDFKQVFPLEEFTTQPHKPINICTEYENKTTYKSSCSNRAAALDPGHGHPVSCQRAIAGVNCGNLLVPPPQHARLPCNVFLVCYAPTVMVSYQSGLCQKTNDAFRNMPATLLPAPDTNGINPWVNIVPLPTTSRLPIRPCIQTSFSRPILAFPAQPKSVWLSLSKPIFSSHRPMV